MAQIETNLQETVKRFEAMQISGRELEKTLHKLVSQVIKEARKRMTGQAKSALANDPRQAYRAVKHMVYKRVLGGNVSILAKRRAGKRGPLPPQQERKGRGGNRIERSKRTEDLMSYWGSDRGFVLRFLNSGTSQRQSPFGNRGAITARNWFPNAGNQVMKQASEQLAQLIEQEIEKFNNR